MNMFSLFTLLGGLAFFIYGMNQMSHSLEIIAGEKMEAIINKLTSNRLLGLLLGCVITVAIQSSSAVQDGVCTLGRGFVLADTLNSYERISEHCSNIAIAILEEGEEEFNPHGYMQHVKSGVDPVFQKLFREYQTYYLSENIEK